MGLGERPVLIGISGGSGCGKTYLAKKVVEEVGSDCVARLSMDWYFRTNRSDMPPNHINFDHPAHLDFDLLVQHLSDLRLGKTIKTPSYDFKTMTQTSDAYDLDPAPVILIEGLFLLAAPCLEFLDLTFFLDVDPDQRVLGRIKRDIAERGAEINAVIDRYQRFVRPSYHVFVGPTKQNADMIVDFTYSRSFFNQMLIHLVRDYVSGDLDMFEFIEAVQRETYQVGVRPEEGAMSAVSNILELGKAFPESVCPPYNGSDSDNPSLD